MVADFWAAPTLRGLMNSSASSSLNPVAPKKITGLQGPWRRVLFVGLYELIAIVCASGLFMLIGQQPGESGAMAVAASVIAMSWNVTFNHWFERWELRQTVEGRSLKRRIAHALGFEGGLGAILIPVMAWWFGIKPVGGDGDGGRDAGLLLVYTYGFNWAFDRIFGLPAAAQG